MATRLMTLGRANRSGTVVVGEATVPSDMDGIIRFTLDVNPPQRTDPNRWVRYAIQYFEGGVWRDFMVDEWRGHPVITEPALGDIEVHPPLSGLSMRGKPMRGVLTVLGSVNVNMGATVDHLTYEEWWSL